MQRTETKVPWLTAAQMIEVDRVMTDDLGIELIQMMENAGLALARLTCTRLLEGHAAGRTVVALAGTGANGGGAMAAARRLAGWGAHVRVVLTRGSGRLAGVPAQQFSILERIGVPALSADRIDEITRPDAVLDGVIGYSLAGPPREGAAALIAWANASGAPILSLDVPSGLNATSGPAGTLVVRATATLTLALPKLGLRVPGSEAYVGELYVADIGVPPGVYASMGLAPPVDHLFADGDIVRLW